MKRWRVRRGKKPHVHKCKSIKEFDKIERKYIKYVNDIYRWGVYYNVLEEEIRSDKFAKYAAKHRPLDGIRQDAIQGLNNNLSFKHKKDGTIYKFIGIQIAVDDYYYLYTNGKDIITATCVGSILDPAEYYGMSE